MDNFLENQTERKHRRHVDARNREKVQKKILSSYGVSKVEEYQLLYCKTCEITPAKYKLLPIMSDGSPCIYYKPTQESERPAAPAT